MAYIRTGSNPIINPSKTALNRSTSNNEHQKLHQSLEDFRKRVPTNPGVHSSCFMQAAGLVYTGHGDTSKCQDCGVEISNWTNDMDPFKTHAAKSSTCPYVLNIQSLAPCSTSHYASNTTSANELENPPKRQKREEQNEFEQIASSLYETDSIRQVRVRTFSHWSHRTVPSSAQMIEAGFFCCNVEDRVICIYCNLICQHWTPHIDDPCEVHKILSPQCIYVKAKLVQLSLTPTSGNGNRSSSSFGFATARNLAYTGLPQRRTSFSTWPTEGSPSVNDLARAGFFYTGSNTIVTCFYCNGSLQNWTPHDNPMIEHIRCFPYCSYAKQLCGDDLYRKIHEPERVQRENAHANEQNNNDTENASSFSKSETSSSVKNSIISDTNTLGELVAARLDLPISQSLLCGGYTRSTIERCWENQLRLKNDDFVSECDLLIACQIVTKQMEHAGNNGELIVIPSVRMKEIREQIGATNQCIVCLSEESTLVCLPCNHLVTCVPCGFSLETCPQCQKPIKAFERVVEA